MLGKEKTSDGKDRGKIAVSQFRISECSLQLLGGCLCGRGGQREPLLGHLRCRLDLVEAAGVLFLVAE
jgi:hypothetical protein